MLLILTRVVMLVALLIAFDDCVDHVAVDARACDADDDHGEDA